MSNTNESQLCLQFAKKYINDIQHQLDQCNNALLTHNQINLENLSLDQLDQRLKEYIYSQQKHFRHKIDCQLIKFKDHVHEKQLGDTLFNGNNLIYNQVSHRRSLMIFF
jgi:hypothetical protein